MAASSGASDRFSRAALALLDAQPGIELLPIPSYDKHPFRPHKPEEGPDGRFGPPRWRRDLVLRNLHHFDR